MKNSSATPLMIVGALALVPGAIVADEIRPARREVTPDVRQAIRRGLAFLGRVQNPSDGSWSCNIGYKLNFSYRVQKGGSNRPHVGVTSLALLAMLAGGNVPGRGPYGHHLERGLRFIVSCVGKNGFITAHGSRMYSHAFATLFLAQVYGMTHLRSVRQPLIDAVDLIVRSQNARGGWRYRPMAIDADMSITVCQLQGLRAARNVGIRVPRRVIERAEAYIRASYQLDGSFRYQLRPHARDSFALTAAGITSLFAAGVYNDASSMIANGLDYLWQHRRTVYPGTYFYYYGHYYASQAMYTAGGQHWTRYFPVVSREIVASQNADGSWPHMVGSTFSTAMATLVLQVPYRMLPIYQR